MRNLEERIKVEQLKESLEEIFAEFGNVVEIVAKTNLRAKGQAFIVFDTVEAATRAIEEVNGFELFDKPMNLDYAKTRSDATVLREDGNDELEAHKRRRLAEKGVSRYAWFFCLVTSIQVLLFREFKNVLTTFSTINRAPTSPRRPRSSEETQAPRPSGRQRPPCEDHQRRRPQAYIRRDYCRRPRRVPTTKQDPLLAGLARRRHPRGIVSSVQPVRGLPRSQIGARSQGNWLRRVRERGWSYQCQGGHFRNGHGRAGQAYSRHLPETIVLHVD